MGTALVVGLGVYLGSVWVDGRPLGAVFPTSRDTARAPQYSQAEPVRIFVKSMQLILFKLNDKPGAAVLFFACMSTMFG